MSEEGTTGKYGRLFGVGVGPGDPELVTLKAKRILEKVAVICVPQAETSAESYAFNIVRGFINLTKQEVIRFRFPTSNQESAADVWHKASGVIANRLQAGQDTAFITEGDPLLYGTFQYILGHLRKNHPELPVEIVPGVSSVMAAAASSETPLASHGESLAVLPAAYGIQGLRETLATYDTVVLMKVNHALLKTLAEFEDLDLAGKSVYVKRASTEQEEVVRDLNSLAQNNLDYFSLLIIRK